MQEAAKNDAECRENGEPAMHKLKLLPEVTALLNRGGAIQQSLVDPENDMLRSITFFLEPTPPDGALPAYTIQKELFAVLPRLPIGAEELRGDTRLGQCILFYTKSKKPEQAIKRQAERLLTKWMGLILKRKDDYRQRDLTASVPKHHVCLRPHTDIDSRTGTLPLRAGNARQTAADFARERALADPTYSNRARVQGGVDSYTIAPEKRYIDAGQSGRQGGGADAKFRRIQMRAQGRGSGK
jgi:transcription factor SPN1